MVLRGCGCLKPRGEGYKFLPLRQFHSARDLSRWDVATSSSRPSFGEVQLEGSPTRRNLILHTRFQSVTNKQHWTERTSRLFFFLARLQGSDGSDTKVGATIAFAQPTAYVRSATQRPGQIVSEPGLHSSPWRFAGCLACNEKFESPVPQSRNPRHNNLTLRNDAQNRRLSSVEAAWAELIREHCNDSVLQMDLRENLLGSVRLSIPLASPGPDVFPGILE